jgi:hypothetical protein
VAPFAYCDGCLASRLGASVELLRAAVAALAVERTIGRARRVCYGCRQAVELSVLEEGAAHEGV